MDYRKVICPDCGRPMALRTARRGSNVGNQFYGCTGYPNCKGIVNIADLPSIQESDPKAETITTEIPSITPSLPRSLIAREIAQGLQVRFFQSLAVSQDQLLSIIDGDYSHVSLRSMSQWRLDFPMVNETSGETAVTSILEKVLLRGKVTLISPKLENEIVKILSTKKNRSLV